MTDVTLAEHKARQRAEADAFLADPTVDTPRYLPVLITASAAAHVRISQPGEVFYDAAGFVSTQCVTNAAKVGDHVSLYMGGRYGCTRAHVEAAWAEGAGVVPNWERNADQALKGYTDGRAAVDSAMLTAAQWGMDTTRVPVAYSGVDFGPTTSQYPVLDDWHRGVQDRSDELGTAQPIAYGHTAYLLHLSQQPWWRGGTWVWAGSGTFAGMTVKQHFTPTSGRDISHIGCTVDENVAAPDPTHPLVIWAGEGFQPEEADLTPEQAAQLTAIETHAAAIDARTKDIQTRVLNLWEFFFKDNGEGRSDYEKAFRAWLDQTKLSDYVFRATTDNTSDYEKNFRGFVSQEVAALLASLPTSTGGATLDEFANAVQLVLTKTKTP